MNPATPTDVAMAFVAKINAHDVDGLVALMTPDHVFVDALGATFRGAEQMRQGWRGYFSLFPDYAIEVTDEFHGGEVVALFGKARGTFAVNGELARENFWEIPAAWRAVAKDERVAEWRVYCDNDPARKIMAAHTAAKTAR
ncbi:MAG: nuclear transport factor 2 family protein [Candidatus Acidiferrales bacterium]